MRTTQPEDIASYANRVGNIWKIGRKGVGDGLLLVVAKDDHMLRIEVAKSLEGAIPDLAAKQGALTTAGAVAFIVHLLTASLVIAGAAGLFTMVMT